MKSHFGLLAFCFLAGLVAVSTAAGQDQSAPPAKAYSLRYDVADIVEKKSFADYPLSGKQSADAGEGLLASVLEVLVLNHPEMAKKFLGQKPQHKLHLLGRKTLEVYADKTAHDQVKALLETFRNADMSLVVESWLFEVKRDVYDKEIAGKLNRLPGSPAVFADPATEETELKFLQGKNLIKPFWEGRKPLRTDMVVLENGESGEFFAWKTPIRYETNAIGRFGLREAVYAIPGFSLALTPVISADRRIVHLKLVQKINQLQGWQKQKVREFTANQEIKDVEFDVPVLRESVFSSTFDVIDGWPVVVEIPWQRADATADSPRLVLLFNVRIRIEEEERLIEKWLEKGKK
jgi:hypothetical protein